MNIITRIFRRINNDRKRAGSAIWLGLTKNVGFLRMFYETKDTEAYVLFRLWFFQKVLGFNKKAYWPTHFRSTVNMPKNIYVGVGSAPGLSPGCYIQGIGKIYIGDYVGVGPNVGLLSGTHQVFDLRKYKSGVLKIGDYSWIGMNSVVMPNVELGPYTIVQAGSTVTESFKTGYCVIGGNPAKLIKQFPQESYHLFEKYKNEYEYHGFIPKRKFEEYRKRNLWV